MARRSIIGRAGYARWSRYVTSRRTLAVRMHATTPVRFLERLQLRSAVPPADREFEVRPDLPWTDDLRDTIENESERAQPTSERPRAAQLTTSAVFSAPPRALGTPSPRAIADERVGRRPVRFVAGLSPTPVQDSTVAAGIDRPVVSIDRWTRNAVDRVVADDSTRTEERGGGDSKTPFDATCDVPSEHPPDTPVVVSADGLDAGAPQDHIPDVGVLFDVDRPKTFVFRDEPRVEPRAAEMRSADLEEPPVEVVHAGAIDRKLDVSAPVPLESDEVVFENAATLNTGDVAHKLVSVGEVPVTDDTVFADTVPVDAVVPAPAPVDPARDTVSRRARVQEFSPTPPEPARRSESTTPAARRLSTRAARTGPYGSRAPESAAPTEADELFRPVEDGVDRSPAAWMARLAASSSPSGTTTPSKRAAAAATPATKAEAPRRLQPSPRPLSSKPDMPGTAPNRERVTTGTPRSAPDSRSFRRPETQPKRESTTAVDHVTVPAEAARALTPLVGVDPATVDIVKGTDATATTQSFRAEALTVGDDTILVRSEFDGRSPHDIGVLAHELTHIGRAREPRFVPPVARMAGNRARGFETEESLATRVEGHVVAVAENRRTTSTNASTNRAPDSVNPDLAREGLRSPIDAREDVGQNRLDANALPPEWGDLPAPWEPLPAWINTASTETSRAAALESMPLSSTATAVAVRSSVAPAPSESSGSSPVVHAADESRIVDHSAVGAAAPAGAASGEPGENAPDLDVLARQVYAVLKRRLEFETRREQLF